MDNETKAGAPENKLDKKTGTDRKKGRKIPRDPVFIILYAHILCVFLYSGYRLFGIASGYLAGRQQYSQTAHEFVVQPDEKPADTPAPETGKDEDAPAPETAPISVDWDALLAMNPDVVGWIYCPDTMVNYPVLRANDNDKYLHTMIDGRYNKAGSIFMDAYCSPRLKDLVTIIYGHHMQDGSMFAMLHNYTDSSYYEKHPVMWYLTPNADYRLDLYAGYLDEPDAAVYSHFTEKEQLEEYLQYSLGRSNFTPAKDFEGIPRVIVLSTCAYEFKDARYLVVTVPVRIR